MKSLRAKLVLLLIVSALTPLILFGVISLFRFQEALRENVETSYQEISLRSAEEISLFINHSREIIETLLEDISETQLTFDQAKRIMENYVIRFSQFIKILVISPDGKLIYSTTLNETAEDLPSRNLLEETQTKTYLYSDPYLSQSITPVIWLLLPIKGKEGDLLRGTLAAQIDLMQMWRWVTDIQLGDSGYANVIDKSGAVIASGNPDYKRAILSSDQPVYFDPKDIEAFKNK